MALVLQTDQPGAGLGLDLLTRDPVTEGANGGVRYIHDLAFPFSYPGGPKPRSAAGAPANGAVVYDASHQVSNGSVVLAASQVINYAGGGFSFAAVNAGSTYVRSSTSFCDDINTAFGGKVQRYLVAAYMKLPTQANWKPSAAGVLVNMTFTTSFYTSAPELFMVEQSWLSAQRRLVLRRQKATNNMQVLVLDLPAGYHDTPLVMAAWRTDAETGFGLYNDTLGWFQATGAVDADNSNSVAGLRAMIGASQANAGSLSTYGNAMNFRHYRMFMENLARSNRDPKSVVEADWARVKRRIAKSAAANGGTSLIFV